MNQLLNTPMPADKALKIIRSMYESNRTLSISIEAKYESQKSIICYSGEVTHFDNNAAYIRSSAPSGIDQILPYDNGVITIVGINQIIPTYSIGQEAMVIETKVIGIVKHIDREIGLYDDNDKLIGVYHRSEIVKIS